MFKINVDFMKIVVTLVLSIPNRARNRIYSNFSTCTNLNLSLHLQFFVKSTPGWIKSPIMAQVSSDQV